MMNMRPPIDIAVEAGLSPTAYGANDVVSPTDCPGPNDFTSYSTISKPMFPDMKHDFMSKSTASTRDDFLSISTEPDEQYNWRYRGMQDAQVRRVGTGDKPIEDQYNSPNRDFVSKVSNRAVNSMDWNQSPTYLRRDPMLPNRSTSRSRERPEFVEEQSNRRLSDGYDGTVNPMLPSRSTSRPRERSEFVEEQSNRRLSDGYDGTVNGTYQRAEVRDRVGEYKRPQHHFENEAYAPHRNGRDAYGEKEILRESPILNHEHRSPTPVNTFGSGTPKSTVERSQTFEGGATRGSREDIYRKNANENYHTEKGQDYGRHEKFFTELQRNGSFSAENGTYDRQLRQREVQGRVEESDRWYSAGGTGDRFSEQDGGRGYYEGRRETTLAPDEVRRSSHSREGMNMRRDNDPRMNAMQGNSNSREERYDNIRTYDDDWSNERYLSKNDRRKKGGRHAAEEDSISQSFSYSEASAEDRGRRRSTSRARSRSRRDPSTETSQHARRHKSSERMGTKPSEFVIDIIQPGVDSHQPKQPDTIISQSKATSKFQNDAVAPTSSPYVVEDSLERELYAKRIAAANLMKEQSEARHQILKEVRQAMEMRDLSTDASNRRFWERQMKTLNASLKRLWDMDDEESFSISEDRDDEINFEEEKFNKTNINAEESPNYKPEPKTPTLSNTRNERETQNLSPTVSQNQSPMVLSPASINNFTTIKVQAPESLPAGHQFTIRVNGKQMKAQVPSGGVNKGDVFTIRIPLNTPPAPTPPPLQIPPTLQNPPTPSTPISSPLTATPSTPSFSGNNNTVKVRAPASMPEGYRFTAKMGDRTIVATVPRGGVQKGEVFVVRVDQ